MLLALRINVLAKGYSGISLETLKQVIEVFNGNAGGPRPASHCGALRYRGAGWDKKTK